MKTSNAKKIASIVIIALVLALTVTTIVLAVIPKSLYNPINSGYSTIGVYRDNITNLYVCGEAGTEEQNRVCNELMDLHEKSLKDNVLSNIFQGTSGFDVDVVNNSYSNVMTIAKADGVLALVFTYLDEQTLKINGEEYKDETAFSSKSVKYNKMFMIINNSQSFEETVVYLTDNANKSSYQIKFLAHQSELYNYIKNLEFSQIKG